MKKNEWKLPSEQIFTKEYRDALCDTGSKYMLGVQQAETDLKETLDLIHECLTSDNTYAEAAKKLQNHIKQYQ